MRPFFASRFANIWWPAPTLSLSLFLIGVILVFAGVFPAPYYVFKLWEASVLLHVIIAVSLFIRGKTKGGTISVSLLVVPVACFWLVS